MDNERFDSGGTPSSEALPAELQALYQHLEHDGVVWRAQTQSHVDEIERSLKIEASGLANLSDAPPENRNHRSLTDTEVADSPLQEMTTSIHGGRSMSTRRRTGVLAVLVAVVVVALLALTFRSFTGIRSTGPLTGSTPVAKTPTTVGTWETLNKLTLQNGTSGSGIAVIAPSNTDVVYQPYHQTSSDGLYIYFLRRTDDGGQTWHNLALPINPKNLNDISVLVSPLDAHAVYLLLADPALSPCTPGNSATAKINGNILASGIGFCLKQYFSTNGGDSWGSVHLSVPGILTGIGMMQPVLLGQGTRLYGMSSCFSGSPCSRLLTSTDGGHNWHVADTPLEQQGQLVCDAAALSTGTTLFAVTSVGNCNRLDQNARAFWRSDDAGTHWTRVGTLPTTNEHGIFVMSRGTGQEPLLYAVLPKTTGHQNDKTGYPQPVISEAPGDLKVSDDGGKTWQSAPSAGIPSSQVMYFSAIGVLSDGSIVAPFTAKDYENASPQPPLTLYRWQPGAESWTRLTQVPDVGQPQSFLVTPQTPDSTDGKDSLWVIIEKLSPPPSTDVMFVTMRYGVG